jgi:hypothetical protein
MSLSEIATKFKIPINQEGAIELQMSNGRSAMINFIDSEFRIQLNPAFLSFRKMSVNVLMPHYNSNGVRQITTINRSKEEVLNEVYGAVESLYGVSGWINRVFEDCV